jgi:cobalamin 5'-phosphate synthase/cobalamin synthase
MAALRFAISFLTCLPWFGAARGAVEPARALGWFPAVGLALGCAQFGLALLLRGWMSDTTLSVLLVAALAALTGGLHLDGVADVFDALGGARGDKDRALAIMRDSRIGAHGATALCLVLLGKVTALADVLARGGLRDVWLAPAVARFCVVALVLLFPYARAEGLGASFHNGARCGDLVLAALLLTAGVLLIDPRALGAALAAFVAAFALATHARKRFGGLTGDVYGAAIELAELTFLLTAARW